VQQQQRATSNTVHSHAPPTLRHGPRSTRAVSQCSTRGCYCNDMAVGCGARTCFGCPSTNLNPALCTSLVFLDRPMSSGAVMPAPSRPLGHPERRRSRVRATPADDDPPSAAASPADLERMRKHFDLLWGVSKVRQRSAGWHLAIGLVASTVLRMSYYTHRLATAAMSASAATGQGRRSATGAMAQVRGSAHACPHHVLLC
jgi:hypothetical protein